MYIYMYIFIYIFIYLRTAPGPEGPELDRILDQVPVGAVAQEREEPHTAQTGTHLWVCMSTVHVYIFPCMFEPS
jgi:hypothetical protein